MHTTSEYRWLNMILDEIRTIKKRQDEQDKKTEEIQGKKTRFKNLSVRFWTRFSKPFKIEVKKVEFFVFTLIW